MVGSLRYSDHIEFLTACPGCSNDNMVILEPEAEYRIFITDADEMSVTVGVCGCEQCGLTFLNPRMGPQTLYKYYAKQSRMPRDKIDVDSPFAVFMELQIDFIEKFKLIKEGMRVLEIGCAEGFFLQSMARRANNKLNLYGVELSEKYLYHAHRLLPDATIFGTPLEETEFGDLEFDLIVLRHVFEHLRNPVDALEKIRSILAPEGILYIEVPDSQNTVPSISRFYHHEHLLYFTVQILNSYLRSSGFQPLAGERFDANPVGSGFSYPVIRSVSVAGISAVLESFPGYAKKVHRENQMRNDVQIESLLAPVRRRLHERNAKQDKIGLYGAGPHTMELLELLEVENIRWNKIFDNNPSKQGKFMRATPIVKPDESTLKSVDCVLVSSAEFEKEMVAQVRSLVGTQVEVITIYGNDASC